MPTGWLSNTAEQFMPCKKPASASSRRATTSSNRATHCGTSPTCTTATAPGSLGSTEFGATDIVAERGEAGIARVMELTGGVGADCVLECVGTQGSFAQAVGCTRKGGHMSFVGVPHGVTLDGTALFFAHIHLHGGPAPVRRFLPELIDLVWAGKIHPGKVFDLELPLDQVAEAYRAMDERRAIKALLRP